MTVRNVNRGRIPSPVGDGVDWMSEVDRRLKILESPDAGVLYSAVKKLQALIEDIQSQLDQWALTRWTNAEITAAINDAIEAALAGDVTIEGDLRVEGEVTMPTILTTDNSAAAGRAAVWAAGTGRLGRT